MTTIQLAVYDLSRGMAIALSQQILGQRIEGIWHTGVIAYNAEFYYGGGIQITPPGVFTANNQMQASTIITIGQTNKTRNELDLFLTTIASRFTAYTYDLLRNNCNNFANEVCIFLTGKSIPAYILNQGDIIFSTPGGAMLRPMIENMSNQAYQQMGHTFDPFSVQQTNLNITNTNTQATTSNEEKQFENNIAKTIKTAIINSDTIIRKAKLEENPLISNDSSSLLVLIKKLFTIAIKLTNNEKELINQSINSLINKDYTNNIFQNIQLYEIFYQLMIEYSSLHMIILFVMRLLVLIETIPLNSIQIIDYIINTLANTNESENFSSIPAITMAICVLSNLLANNNGIIYIINENSKERLNKLIDISVNYLNHKRIEIRQISSVLGYNFTLINTKQNKLTNIWLNESNLNDKIIENQSKNEIKSELNNENETETERILIENEYNIELHNQAVQLFVSSIDNIQNETDLITRKRRLAIACRIVRVYGLKASELARDLGFLEIMQEIHTQYHHESNHKNKTEYEESIITELSIAFAC